MSGSSGEFSLRHAVRSATRNVPASGARLAAAALAAALPATPALAAAAPVGASLAGAAAVLAAVVALAGLVALRDTARRRGAQARSAVEAQLRLVLEGAEAATWDIDLATGAGTWSERHFDCLGLPRRPDGAGSMQAWRERVHPDDIGAITTAFQTSVETGVPYRAKYRIRRADTGEERWLSAYGCVLRDAANRPARSTGVILDVTDRVRAGNSAAEQAGEVALARAAEEFRTLADNISQLAWMSEPDGALFWYNRRWFDYTGTTLEQMRGWGWRAVHHPDHVARVEAKFREAVAAGREWEDTFPLRGADGQFRWFLSRAMPIRDAEGRILRWFGTNTDITAQRDTETALAASEARFRAAIAAVQGILWTNNASGEMTGEQPGWAALTGQSREEYQGYGWASAVHPEDAQPTVDAWSDAVAETKPFVFEHRVRRHDGAWRRFAVRAIPVLRPDGGVLEWVGVHTDVTAQREAEAVLARDRAELERLVAARTEELAAAQARLAHAQRMEALGQLAGGIAHDFNNVLQAVQGGARMIEARAHEADRVQRLAALIAEAANRGASVTGRLLAFSRRADLRAEPVAPGALLAGLREILAHTLGAGIDIVVQAPATLPPLLADRGQLETVLINLAANARDAMTGSGTLTLSAALETNPARAPAPVLRPSGLIRLSVADTGAGMTEAVLARASEPFFTTKPPGRGTGLGLAMARGFAEQSGGALAIESAPGSGTTVRLWLPLAAGTMPDPPEAKAAAPAAPGPRRRVLLVDDEAMVRDIVAEQLEEAGFAVVSAAAASQGLARLEAGETFDILVSDLSMPEMDGLTLIRRAQALVPDLPAILLTGYATDAAELAVGGALSGSFTLLRKPTEGKALAARISALLEMVPGGE